MRLVSSPAEHPAGAARRPSGKPDAILLGLVLCLPIPLLAVTGLTIPLPTGVVEAFVSIVPGGGDAAIRATAPTSVVDESPVLGAREAGNPLGTEARGVPVPVRGRAVIRKRSEPATQPTSPTREPRAFAPESPTAPVIRTAPVSATTPAPARERAPEPVAARPVAAQPVAAQPVVAQPVVAQPVVAQPSAPAAEPRVEPVTETRPAPTPAAEPAPIPTPVPAPAPRPVPIDDSEPPVTPAPADPPKDVFKPVPVEDPVPSVPQPPPISLPVNEVLRPVDTVDPGVPVGRTVSGVGLQ